MFSAADGDDDEDDEDDDDGDDDEVEDDDEDADDDDDHRHRDETHSDDEHTDGAQTGWTSKCVRGYARYMLAVWAGGGSQAASCLAFFIRSSMKFIGGSFTFPT